MDGRILFCPSFRRGNKGDEEKAERGGYQARPPLGYRIEEHGKPPVIVPEEAEIIKLIFKKYVDEKKGFLRLHAS